MVVYCLMFCSTLRFDLGHLTSSQVSYFKQCSDLKAYVSGDCLGETF